MLYGFFYSGVVSGIAGLLMFALVRRYRCRRRLDAGLDRLATIAEGKGALTTEDSVDDQSRALKRNISVLASRPFYSFVLLHIQE